MDCHSFYVLGVNNWVIKFMTVQNDIAHYVLYAYENKTIF